MNITRIEIIVTDRSLVRKAYLTSPTSPGGTWELIEADFDLRFNEGCNKLKMSLLADADGTKPWGSILNGYLITIKAQPVGGSMTEYWAGVITQAPGTGTTARVLEYEARGGFFEFEKQKLVYYYEGAAIDDAVIDIKGDFDTPVTCILATNSEISVASPYTVADIESEFESPAEPIKQFALMQTDVQYGVDQLFRFYFKDITTSEVAHFVIGTDVAEITVEEDTEALINDVYVQSKEMVAGGQVTLHDSDSASQTAYGKRTKLYQLRNTKSSADGYQYAAGLVATQKDPRQKVEASLPTFSEFIFPRGNVRIVDTDGTEYSFPIQRVSYKIDGKKGLFGSMELGSEIVLNLPETLQEVMRVVERQNRNGVSLTKIAHARGEEFAQQVYVNARKSGLFNHYIAFLSDDNCIDKNISTFGSQAFYNGQIVGPFGYLANRLWSNAIPTRYQPDSVMLHTYTSELGRVTFDNDNDFDMFFEGSPGNWRVDETGHGAEAFDVADDLFYRRGGAGSKGTPWELPANHSLRLRFKQLAVNTGRPFIINWGHTSSSNRNWLEVDMSSSSNLRVVIKSQAGFGVTTHETMNDATMSTGEEREIQILYGAVSSQYTVRIFDTDGTTVLQTSAAFTPTTVVANSRIAMQNFYNNTDSPKRVAQLLWFEPQQINLGNNTVYINRNNGSGTNASDILNDGIQHQTFDLSTITAGEVLKVLFINKHPGRIIGWGISW